MSTSNAKKFIINFYGNSDFRIKIASIIKENLNYLNKENRLNYVILTAKKLGFNFTKKELKLVNKINYRKLNESELEIIKGGVNINKNIMQKTNLKLEHFLDVF